MSCFIGSLPRSLTVAFADKDSSVAATLAKLIFLVIDKRQKDFGSLLRKRQASKGKKL